jgi:hypothetical protein
MQMRAGSMQFDVGGNPAVGAYRRGQAQLCARARAGR